jgi:putative ABC transport system permease protein
MLYGKMFLEPMTALLGELGPAIRRLLSDRWAAIGGILAAALGAGLNTAVFAVAYGVLLRPLPYANADRLAIVDVDAPLPRVMEWRRHLTAFDRVTGYGRDRLTVRGAGEARLLGVALVDDEFFDTLDVRSEAGVPFRRGDPTAVAAISDRFARQAAGSAAALIGRTLTIGGSAATVVAVMPPAFAFPAENIDVWMPAHAVAAIAFDLSPDARRFQLVGRMRPGVSVAQARDDVARARTRVDTPGDQRESGPRRVASLQAEITQGVRPALIAFAVAAVIVLMVACSNVATILIGRTASRRRELAVRRALGASPARLLMTVLSESIVIAVAGAAGGMLLAVTAIRLVERWVAGIVPRLADIRIDWIVLLFACGVAAVSAALGAAPAFGAVRDGAVSLRAGGAGPRGPGSRARGALIVIQVALAVVLLTTGALLVRTIVGLLHGDAGIEAHGAVVSQLMLTETTRFDAAGRAPLLDELLRRIRALPGVTSAGAGSSLPPDNAHMEIRVRLVSGAREEVHSLSLASVTPGYLPALGARLLAGRHFEDSDARRDRPAAVLSETAARALMAGRDPIGRELPMPLPGLRGRGPARVIGVVRDIKYAGLGEPAGGTVYVMWSEVPTGQAYLAVRTSAQVRTIPPAVRAIMREIDPGMPVQPFRSLDDVLGRSVADRRLRALLGGSIACLAFAVALVGLAGGLARVVSERRDELAIRAALGATPARAMRMIMTEGAALAGTGLVLGIAGSLAAGRAIASMLHGVGPNDPVTLAGIVAIVSVTTLGACYLPARRAARVNPLELLRSD